MKRHEWVFCDRCKRVFEAELSEMPRFVSEGEVCIKDAGILAGDFLSNFQVTEYPRCPYSGCDGTRLEFYWWFDVRNLNPDYPHIPTSNVRYPW
jgi:hypothetical protein